jgi:hypothetical protein
VIVIDEYLAVDVVRGEWPDGLPDNDDLVIPSTCHYRLLQRIHNPGRGQLSALLAGLSAAGRETIRHPHPEVLQVLDPRPLLDEAALIGAHYRTGGLLVTETLSAGFTHRRELYFGTEANVGRRMKEIASDLGIAIHVITSG